MFRPEFEPMILTDTKDTTIRPTAWEVGETYSARVWTGLPYRTPQHEFAKIACLSATPVQIFPNTGHIYIFKNGDRHAVVDTIAFAKRDGFRNDLAMMKWFAQHHAKEIKKHGFFSGFRMEFTRVTT